MNYNQTRNFVIGALAHGLPFETAFGLVTQAQQQRQQRKGAEKRKLSDLIKQGVEMASAEGADPELVASSLQALATAEGVKPRGQKKVARALSGVVGSMGGSADPETLTQWSEDFAEGYEDQIATMLEEGKSLAEIRTTLAPQAQYEAAGLGQDWSAIGPHFNAMIDASVYRNLDAPGKKEFMVRKAMGAGGVSARQQDQEIRKLTGDEGGGAGGGGEFFEEILGRLGLPATVGAGVGAVGGFRRGQGLSRLSGAFKGVGRGAARSLTMPSQVTGAEFKALRQPGMPSSVRAPSVGRPVSGWGNPSGAGSAGPSLGQALSGLRVGGSSMVGVPTAYTDPDSPYFGGAAPESDPYGAGAASWEPPEMRDLSFFEKSPAGSLWALAKGLF